VDKFLAKILHDLAEKKARGDSRGLPTLRTCREPSVSEKSAIYTPPNYGVLFCPHSKSYFDVCAACKRTRRDARLQYEHFCLKHGLDY
jgi:hypothetical protein